MAEVDGGDLSTTLLRGGGRGKTYTQKLRGNSLCRTHVYCGISLMRKFANGIKRRHFVPQRHSCAGTCSDMWIKCVEMKNLVS